MLGKTDIWDRVAQFLIAIVAIFAFAYASICLSSPLVGILRSRTSDLQGHPINILSAILEQPIWVAA